MNSAIAVSHGALSRVWRSRLARNVAVVASGTAGAQVITVAFAPLITRIYGPEAFGLLGAFQAIVAVVAPAAALAFPIAIVLPESDRDALQLARLSFILSLSVASLVTGILLLGGDPLTANLGAQSLAGCLFLVPVAMIFSAWMQIAQQWLIRKKRFTVVARAAITHSLFLNTAKAGVGWFYPLGAVLIVLATLGHALHATLLFIGARRHRQVDALEKKQATITSLRELAYRHRDFPLYRAPQIIMNAASQSLPLLMLGALFGPAAAGFYTLGTMVMGMPSNLLGKAVKDVFYPRITEAAYGGENLSQHIVRATVVLLAAGIIPFGVIILWGRWMFSMVFGEDWAMAGEYARWLAVFFLFNFINKPSVAAVPVLGVQRGLLVYELFSTGGKAIGLVAGFYWFGSDLLAIALFSIIGAVAYGAMIFWVAMQAIRWRRDAKAS